MIALVPEPQSMNGGGRMTTSDDAETLSCIRHPDRSTVLRCGRCNAPICVACTVQTPVGARCPACAQMRRLPTYEVSLRLYLRAAGAGLATGLLGGMVISGLLRGLFAIWLAPVFGWLVGEVVARAANLRRGPGLQAIAAAAVLVGAVFGPALPAIVSGRPIGTALLQAVLVAGGDLWVGVFGLLAVFFAVQRVR